MAVTLRHYLIELKLIQSTYKHVTLVVLIFTLFFKKIYCLLI